MYFTFVTKSHPGVFRTGTVALCPGGTRIARLQPPPSEVTENDFSGALGLFPICRFLQTSGGSLKNVHDWGGSMLNERS